MLALPERVPEPPTLSLAELQALSAWKRRSIRYRPGSGSTTSEALLEIAGLSDVQIGRMRFLAWAYDTGRITP